MVLRAKALHSLRWTSLSQVGQQILTFANSVVLARLLLPSDFGLMAMALVLIDFLNILKDLGTSSAVIQQKELAPRLLSSIFWVNVLFGALGMIGLIICAPTIAAFYHEPRVIPILQALSVVFFLSCLSILQKALLERNLAFQSLAKIETGVAIISFAVGVGAAMEGAGVWSLVLRAMIGGFLSTVLLTASSKYKPTIEFSWTELKKVSRYSLNLTGFNIVNYFSRNVDYILVGRFLGAGSLGYYSLAYKIMLYPLSSMSAVIGRVMFPLYAQLQDENSRFQHAYLKVVGAIAFFSFPAMLGLMALATPFVLTVFGQQWAPAIPVLLILAPVGMLQSINTTVGSIYQSKGRADWMLWTGIAWVGISVAAFSIGLRWGIIGVATGYAVAFFVCAYPDFAIPFYLIDLKMGQFLKALSAPLLCSVIMFVSLLGLMAVLPSLSSKWLLGLLVPMGSIVYCICSWFLNGSMTLQVLEMGGVRPGLLFRKPANVPR